MLLNTQVGVVVKCNRMISHFVRHVQEVDFLIPTSHVLMSKDIKIRNPMVKQNADTTNLTGMRLLLLLSNYRGYGKKRFRNDCTEGVGRWTPSGCRSSAGSPQPVRTC